ncbi:EAL domain-containing protein [Paraburkholderia sediminicola]|uniref:EAL domain-containing protein n=1 Tax=Paraburkholderia sediminicola TaxID=458836 RepID=UPI0038BBBA59
MSLFKGASAIVDLARGLKAHDFFFAYRPRLRIRERKLCGFELTVQRQRPLDSNRDCASLSDAVAESAASDNFTDLILETAGRHLSHWKQEGRTGLTLSVNIPTSELVQADLPGKLKSLVVAHKLNPRRLQITLTETPLASSVDELADATELVQAMGVGIALHGFGPRQNSLALLHQLALDTLRIDRCYMSNVPEDPESGIILETCIKLGHRLGKRVVLDGIETDAQFTWVHEIHEDIDCQGSHISEALQAPLLEALISLRRYT